MAKCPHCEQHVDLDNVQREVEGSIKKEILYSCPYCQKVLGCGFFFGGLLTGRP